MIQLSHYFKKGLKEEDGVRTVMRLRLSDGGATEFPVGCP